MSAPDLSFSISGYRISSMPGFDRIVVTFSSDIAYTAFECRATKVGDAWGVGVGYLIASFSSTPAATQRTFEIYDNHLVQGEGKYRISLFARSEDGEWNDSETHYLITEDRYAILFGETRILI